MYFFIHATYFGIAVIQSGLNRQQTQMSQSRIKH
jgi:hypothetical protein